MDPSELAGRALSPALAEYLEAFSGERKHEKWLTFYTVGSADGSRTLTRAKTWQLACRAARLLKVELGLRKGDSHVHFFHGNSVEDVVLRLAAVMVGTVPVTVNWDGDTIDRIVYKVRSSGARVVLVHAKTPAEQVAMVKREVEGVKVVAIDEALADEGRAGLDAADFDSTVDEQHTRIVVYTSGSSGEPKGVCLSYRSYLTNRLTFEAFLQVGAGSVLRLLLVNPLHHTNSTAFSDWAMRRPGSQLHLFERYTTPYWATLVGLAVGGPLSEEGGLEAAVAARAAEGVRVMAPTVSRHFDFLEALAEEEGGAKLRPLTPRMLKLASPLLEFIVGSAPVGPATVARFEKYLGRLPTIRFGSTETCLQVLGTPLTQTQEARKRAFQRGWDAPEPGYYIGRPHPPYTEVMVMKTLEKGKEGYLKEASEGALGYLATRGNNLFSGYLNDEAKTNMAIDRQGGGWYLNLGDMCFWLTSADNGGKDYYWVSRTSNLLIRGGSNYSYYQVSSELSKFVCAHYGLEPSSFALAAVGLRLTSEHDDDVLVTIQLLEQEAQEVRTKIEEGFVAEAKKVVSKGAKPDRVRVAAIPRNFKGDISWKALEKEWKEAVDGGKG